MIKRLVCSVSIFLFLLLSALLISSAFEDTHFVSTGMINEPFPEFAKYELRNLTKVLSKRDILGKTTILTVWSSWCRDCEKDFSSLAEYKNTSDVALYGLDFRDSREEALDFLHFNGNPFSIIIFDPYGSLSNLIGAYDVPETYVIDRDGIVRYKIVEPLTPKMLREKINPIVLSLVRKGKV